MGIATVGHCRKGYLLLKRNLCSNQYPNKSTKMMKIAIALVVCLSVAYVFAAEEKDEYGHDKDEDKDEYGHGKNDTDTGDKDEYGHGKNDTDTGDKDEYGHGGSDSLGALVHKEVAIIVSKNPAMTSGQCTQRCDDLFGMFDDGNEMSTDSHCMHDCQCDIDKNCS